jgi:hypothetical protein
MGQYLGDRKIGTCESMYYMRLEEAEQLAKEGKRDNDGISFEDYIKDNTTRFRFPFPDEDAGIPDDCKYNKSFMIPCSPDLEEVGHTTICLSSQTNGSGQNVNIIIPCPHDPKFKELGIKTSPIGQQYLNVTMEAIRDGKRKTIFECARCGQAQRFDDADIVKIKAHALAHFESYRLDYLDPDTHTWKPDEHAIRQLEYAKKVLDRIF